ncbi:MAG: methyltransferase domain-containing protein [Phycisphaerales bacterium]|nr:methyltransferase domain-containing protein [Phycisphaerales bacterium]
MSINPAMDVEKAVRSRYSEGAKVAQEALCCPSSSYDEKYLAAIPQEIIDKDYGCGDPTAHCEEGQIVLDLGSGAGKACYIMSQRVGPNGRVIGIDMNDDMLALARQYREEITRKIGYANVEFRKARIQDLRLDLEKVDAWLKERPARSAADLTALESYGREISQTSPVVADNSIDLIVSNCVLNLVRPEDKSKLFSEMFRILRKGGRAVISDVVSDEDVPDHLQQDPELWSGCISGAFREDLFLKAFEDAGFHGIEILKLDDKPWQTVEGIEFRSMTVSAYKGKQGPCYEHNQAVVYKGPFSAVQDDDGHRYPRGARIAVCEKTFNLLRNGPYRDQFSFIEPHEAVASEDAVPFDCKRTVLRHPRETKGVDYKVTTEAADCCGPEGCC